MTENPNYQRLTQQQENFCRIYLQNGEDALAAYKEAGYSQLKDNWEAAARRMPRQIKIKLRLESIKRGAMQRSDITIEKIAKAYWDIYLKAMSIDNLKEANAALTKLGEWQKMFVQSANVTNNALGVFLTGNDQKDADRFKGMLIDQRPVSAPTT